MNDWIMNILAIPARLVAFVEDHPIYSLIIFILIFSYFVPIPYLHDFVKWVVEFIKSLDLISVKN